MDNTLVVTLNQSDRVLLIILVVLLSLFFLLSTIAVGFLIKILSSVRRVADKAERVVDNVETAAEALKDASGKMTFLKLLGNIFDSGKKK